MARYTHASPLNLFPAITLTLPSDFTIVTAPEVSSLTVYIVPSADHSTLSGLLTPIFNLVILNELEDAENTPPLNFRLKSNS